MHTIEVQIVQESPNQTEPKYYSQSGVTIKPHNPHANCPDSLSCLPDTQGRPQHTLPVILRCAILGSPKRRLTIREIYGAMESKYPYYKSAGPAWKVRLYLFSLYLWLVKFNASRDCFVAIRPSPSFAQ